VNFLLDHDVPAEVGRVLGQAGHQVVHVRTVMPPESTDDRVLQYAVKHSLVLLTCNREDFVRLAGRQAHPGLVVVIRRRTRIAECASVLRLLKRAGDTGIAGNINFA
jgi:predicted nuclease of predicted toxin-antitoxin system